MQPSKEKKQSWLSENVNLTNNLRSLKPSLIKNVSVSMLSES